MPLNKIITEIEENLLEYNGNWLKKNKEGNSLPFTKRDLTMMIMEAYREGVKDTKPRTLKHNRNGFL